MSHNVGSPAFLPLVTDSPSPGADPPLDGVFFPGDLLRAVLDCLQ